MTSSNKFIIYFILGLTAIIVLLLVFPIHYNKDNNLGIKDTQTQHDLKPIDSFHQIDIYLSDTMLKSDGNQANDDTIICPDSSKIILDCKMYGIFLKNTEYKWLRRVCSNPTEHFIRYRLIPKVDSLQFQKFMVSLRGHSWVKRVVIDSSYCKDCNCK
jgi:hypothetical protein